MILRILKHISNYLRFRIDDSWKESSKRRSQRAEAVKRLLLGLVSRSVLDFPQSACGHCLCLRIVFDWRKTMRFSFLSRVYPRKQNRSNISCAHTETIYNNRKKQNLPKWSSTSICNTTNNEIPYKYSFKYAKYFARI